MISINIEESLSVDKVFWQTLSVFCQKFSSIIVSSIRCSIFVKNNDRVKNLSTTNCKNILSFMFFTCVSTKKMKYARRFENFLGKDSKWNYSGKNQKKDPKKKYARRFENFLGKDSKWNYSGKNQKKNEIYKEKYIETIL